MKKLLITVLTLGFTGSAFAAVGGTDSFTGENGLKYFEDKSASSEVVTVRNYAQAESERNFLIQQERVGINNWLHYREPTPVDKQNVVRMQKDTLYSTILVDTTKGAEITLPAVEEGRYLSLQQVDGNHFTRHLAYGGTEPNIVEIKGSTPYVWIVVRLGTDATEADMEKMREVQNNLVLKAGSAVPFVPVNYETKSFEATHHELLVSASKGINSFNMFGASDEVDAYKHPIGAAMGWAGANTVDNVYQAAKQNTNMQCQVLTFDDPKNGAFWSLTVYNKDIYMFSENASLNSYTAEPNADGTFTIHFGCEGKKNNIDINNDTGAWNLMMRHYQPSEIVKSGDFNVLDDLKVLDD
ncbi:DUF1254 domain-containing protein [Vibrio cionasavignyae]|uniref:DUF1254 domain-containing protein n=1 Tax=Vibrio cionasavignyae TaxID=2910252 RepID=UPI003D14C93A